ncbi:hypothetical protein AVEN_4350-1 [Araneus ventricosus]|uniref:Uncharacterized protein n=1 Tax=Araneus ventricosus TaxID=182803 RepID=A0A4Y2PGN5_ARAVE|nr:hypothetical protein AVEN_4350-1 [Araneus ventricosus]
MLAFCTATHTSGAKRGPTGLVYAERFKEGEKHKLRCRPRHLTAVQIFEFRPKIVLVLLQNVKVIKVNLMSAYLCAYISNFINNNSCVEPVANPEGYGAESPPQS